MRQAEFMNKNGNTPKTTCREYCRAFLEYLGRPKTVFDMRDRLKALLLLAALIIALQKVVQILAD